LLTTALTAWPAQARAEWQIKPFLGVKFAGYTTFIDVDQAAGGVSGPGAEPGRDLKKVVIGVSGMWIGEVVGFEADLGHVPGYFQSDVPVLSTTVLSSTTVPSSATVLKSGVTTFTGNVVIAVPKHLVRYSLRPYFAGGAGLMSVDKEDAFDVFKGDNLPTMDLGGGVTGFLTKHVGVSWDVRYFRSIGGNPVTGLSYGPEQLSFWRATMAAAIRF
jgi:hypothetical protein